MKIIYDKKQEIITAFDESDSAVLKLGLRERRDSETGEPVKVIHTDMSAALPTNFEQASALVCLYNDAFELALDVWPEYVKDHWVNIDMSIINNESSEATQS